MFRGILEREFLISFNRNICRWVKSFHLWWLLLLLKRTAHTREFVSKDLVCTLEHESQLNGNFAWTRWGFWLETSKDSYDFLPSDQRGARVAARMKPGRGFAPRRCRSLVDAPETGLTPVKLTPLRPPATPPWRPKRLASLAIIPCFCCLALVFREHLGSSDKNRFTYF